MKNNNVNGYVIQSKYFSNIVGELPQLYVKDINTAHKVLILLNSRRDWDRNNQVVEKDKMRKDVGKDNWCGSYDNNGKELLDFLSINGITDISLIPLCEQARLNQAKREKNSAIEEELSDKEEFMRLLKKYPDFANKKKNRN